MNDQTTTSAQASPTTAEDNFRTLFHRTAKLNDAVSALLNPAWGSETGLIPPGHPLYVGEETSASNGVTAGMRDLSIPEQAPAAARPRCTCAGVGFGDGSCKVHNPPADDEDAQRTARRDSTRNLLDRLQRMGLTDPERALLRQHVEAEMREADTARSVAAGNKRHVQVMYAELEQANEAARRALEQRQEMAEERYAWQERGDRAEREAETADRIRAEAQRTRDQHAAVLAEVLAAFVHKVDGYRVPRVRAEADVVTLEKWRSVVAPTAERPWWVDVAEIRAELEELRGHLRYVLDYRGPGHDHQVEGRWDRDGSPCDHCARLAAARAALGGVEQPTTPDGSTA